MESRALYKILDSYDDIKQDDLSLDTMIGAKAKFKFCLNLICKGSRWKFETTDLRCDVLHGQWVIPIASYVLCILASLQKMYVCTVFWLWNWE